MIPWWVVAVGGVFGLLLLYVLLRGLQLNRSVGFAQLLLTFAGMSFLVAAFAAGDQVFDKRRWIETSGYAGLSLLAFGLSFGLGAIAQRIGR